MPLQNLARDMLADAITGGATYNRFNNANAYLGVGTSTTAHAPTQTDLLGTSDRQPMVATYPQRAANVVTWRSLWDTGDGNFDWQEIGIFNAAASGQMLARFLDNIGVKTSAVTRQLTVTQTFVLT